jgi:aspartyl-tRNA(Asn)/glutamyl-tRNA(Gln) amidotransferase subunit C
MNLIDKKLLDHLAELSRVELTASESKKLLDDLRKILEHFEELKLVDTEKVEPVTGGAVFKNIFREDEIDFDKRMASVNHGGRIIDAFPAREKGYLKVPKVL